MFTGRDALFSVEQAISAGPRMTRAASTPRCARPWTKPRGCGGEEAEGFRMLARVRLDAMVREKVIGDLDADERRALA